MFNEVAHDQENLRRKRELYRWSTIGGYPPYLLCSLRMTRRTHSKSDKHRFDAVQEQGIRTGCQDLWQQADVYKEKNVGLRPDWYTDAVFAQQHFTGVNPTALKRASDDWVKAFAKAFQLISTYPSSLYVVDNSDYPPGHPVQTPNGPVYGQPAYGCASITLFSLSDFGRLHPLAICLDYKGSLEKSVTIFNKCLTAYASSDSEAEDWPWRFAKMCSMTSDWTRHELAVHLTETHLVEEAIIIAAQRNLPDSHIVYQLLKEHWYKTLSLNYLARATLVPKFIEGVAPLELPHIMNFIKQSYMNFDFVGRYAPTDLKDRGFDPSKLDDKKFHNYLYARNISKIWVVLRSFVSDVLRAAYPNGDVDVLADKFIPGFCTEMRSQQGGQLPSFPRRIETLDELIDMHNAINYLQQFYLSFVPNRPGSLAAPLPSDLKELQAYTEDNILDALPVKGLDIGEWMLMAQVPYLLSAEVDAKSNIEQYAADTLHSKDSRIKAAGPAFQKKILALKPVFDKYNKEMDDKVTEYHVLDPKLIARSILI
ncbi:Lipoxygenase [Coprinellus micaceus]|uniref:Manganese lipoxygenase n=1 Tax=Coprinellus micaceus TaxID=71717 RepID=A0A4Y7S7Z4_COPMI|nr:Lipoxygenase [Coprinellus micaceus]